MKLPPLILALRPHQWVKNIFVLAALVFAWGESGEVHDGAILATIITVAAFCLGSSAIYLLNDIADVESDRAHPKKRHRPIASGALSIRVAKMAWPVCAAAAMALAWWASRVAPEIDPTSIRKAVPFGIPLIIGAYMSMNFLYSWKLKQIVLVDVFCIATGFILRVMGGGHAAGTLVSQWLMLCTMFLALFLALCKRRAEMDLLGDDSKTHRAALAEYDLGFIDQMVTVLAACTIVCYTMWTVADDTAQKFGAHHHLIWTVPFVVFGLGRYMLLVQTHRGGGSPTRMLLGGDLTFVLNCVAWLAVILLVAFNHG